MELYFWRPGGRLPLNTNFGDELSRVVVRFMLKSYGLSLTSRGRDVRLLAIGSVLHQGRDGDVVWGSGRNGRIADADHRFSMLDVRAVRGPLTRAFLTARGVPVPEIYGDPALLLPRFLSREEIGIGTMSRSVTLVPHLFDLSRIGSKRLPQVDRIVSPRWNWYRCVRAIADSGLVISSSLHGLIVAEAYGIPARRLRLAKGEPDFKYEDYYQGTGRPRHRPAASIEEALHLGGERAPVFDGAPLMDAFPYDLWQSDLAYATPIRPEEGLNARVKR